MNRMFLPALALAALPFDANALQIKQATDNGQITAIVSAQEISRVSLLKDRIRMVNGDKQVDITHDAETGDVYIKPSDMPLSKPLNLFIATEKGFTYQLLLIPKSVPSEQVLIRNEDVLGGSGQAQAWEHRTPFHRAITQVMKATIGGDLLPAGYKKEVLRESAERRQHLSLRRLYAVSGSVLQGIALELRNEGNTPLTLSERDLFKPDHVAVYLPERHLAADSSLTAYIVRRRTGGRP